MDSLSFECRKQLKFMQQLEASGFQCVDDPANLYDKVGTVQELECFCSAFTQKLLVKLYPPGLEESSPHSFYLVPLWQIIRYSYVLPVPGEIFKARYVIGVRKVSRDGFVPSLRLPLQ
jgi:hypothetical protein